MRPRAYRFLKSLPLSATIVVMAMSCSMVQAADSGLELFEKQIRPLFIDHCQKCHDSTKGKSKGGLVLDSREGWVKGGDTGPAIVPGQPEKSLLYLALTYEHDDVQMPPKKEGGKLSDKQIAAVKQWISSGAPDPRDGKAKRMTGLTPEARAHWAYQPVVEPAVPAVKSGWVRNEIDAFVLSKLQANGMKPNPQADKLTLIRRVTYDLIGMPPSSEDIAAFVADKSPDAFAKVVDRLLASPHYGERWGRHWLNSARYSDTMGLKSNGGKYRWEDYRYDSAWTYRDYVIKAFNDDKPWNDFLVEQLAADLIPGVAEDDPRLAALGFITVGRRFDNYDDIIDERIDTVTKAMLGVTVSCSRCHDHKFDPFSTADYYALHGVFNNINEPHDRPMLPRSVDPEQAADFQRRIDELTEANRTTYYEVLRSRLSMFHEKAEGYLRLVVINNRSPERREIAEKYGLHPENRTEIREVIGALRMRSEDPIVGPYARLARIKPDEFAARAPKELDKALNDKRRPVNALVKAALKDAKLDSIDDVVAVYVKLFATAAEAAPAYIDAMAMPGSEPPDIAPELAQLIAYPFPIADIDELMTPEQQIVFFQKYSFDNKTIGAKFTFPAINYLRLTHPGAQGRAMVITDKEKPRDSYIYIRGERNKKGPVVPRSFPEVLTGGERKPFTQGSGRWELAQAIASPTNPLTARVAVNRVWMHHFGEGFVITPDDMGVMSPPVVQKDLFEWLSARFVADGWSMKKLHRMILLSATYQQSAANNPDFAQKDPSNTLYWRSNLRRLDLEAIRDSLVALSGKLDETIGGQPVNISDEPYSYRRSVYGYVDRASLSDMMVQFDFSDPDMPNTKRINTIVPQQALFFMNSPMVAGAARTLMARDEVVTASDDAGRVTALYTILFQREPTQQEIELATAFIAEASKSGMPQSKPDKKPKKPAKKPNVSKSKSKADKNKYEAITNQGTMVDRSPLKPWELYAQALICSNEFVYVN